VRCKGCWNEMVLEKVTSWSAGGGVTFVRYKCGICGRIEPYRPPTDETNCFLPEYDVFPSDPKLQEIVWDLQRSGDVIVVGGKSKKVVVL